MRWKDCKCRIGSFVITVDQYKAPSVRFAVRDNYGFRSVYYDLAGAFHENGEIAKVKFKLRPSKA